MALTFTASIKNAIIAHCRRLAVAMGASGTEFDTSVATITDAELMQLVMMLHFFGVNLNS